MRVARYLVAGVVLCLVLPARAETPSPLRLVPDSAEVLLELPSPTRAVDLLLSLYMREELQIFPPYREFLDSTPVRRGQQLLAYVEKQLGASHNELLDRLAGGGVFIASQFSGPQPAPALMVLQGRDAKLSARFFDTALDVLDQELARQEGKDRVVRGDHHGVVTAHVGNNLWAACAGTALLLSNKDKALEAAIDRHLGRETKSLAGSKEVEEAWLLLPKGCLARVWISLKAAHLAAAGKPIYKVPRDDAALTVLFGTYLDLAGRSPYICVGLVPEHDGFLLTARMPAGREGMGGDQLLHVAPAGKPGSRPLLTPKGVLYSESNYFDFANIYLERTKLFNDKQIKGLEEFDNTSGRFLLGNRMSKLLEQVAPYYRFVAVRQGKSSYNKEPQQRIPAFALVVELRDEKLGKVLDGAARAAAFLGGLNAPLKLAEETHEGQKLVGWRFDEKAPFRNDTTDFRFNFSPCFARVGNQFLACSTIELGREMIAVLQKEAKEKDPGAAAAPHAKAYGDGVADLLEGLRDQLMTQTILDQAVKPEDAEVQVKALIDLVRHLGTLELAATVEAKHFHYDVRLKTTK
jgi:hypothetical protein